MFKLTIKNEAWLLFLRVAVPLFLIVQLMSFYGDFHLFFSADSLILPDIMKAALMQQGLAFIDVQEWLGRQGYAVEYFTLSKILIGAHIGFLILLAAGFLTRLSALISIALHLLLLQTIHAFLYGGDFFSTILLFYCFVFPVNKYYSLDNLMRRNRPGRLNAFIESLISTKVMLRVIQAHLCIAYFFSGFEKLLGFNWRNGESAWKAIHNYEGIINFEKLEFLATTPAFLIASWATILLEMLFPLMANNKYTRLPWVGGIIGMHLIIVLILGLFHFSAVMIIFNMVAYVIPYSDGFSLQASTPSRRSFFPKLKISPLRAFLSSRAAR